MGTWNKALAAALAVASAVTLVDPVPAGACSVACPTGEAQLSTPVIELVSGDASASPPELSAGVLTWGGDGAVIAITLDDGQVVDSLGVAP